MAAKIFFVVCAQAILIQYVLSQCLNRGPALAPYGLAYDGLAYGGGCGCNLAAPTSTGGGFAVTSYSPIAPTGLSIVSENAIEGALSVGGEVPFLGAVALEGVLPTFGMGAISYGCGNGAVGITSEGPIATGIVGSAYAPGLAAAPGYAPGLAAAPAYGPGLAYGPGMAYGPGLAPGLGYNGLAGIGCGCGL